MKKLIAGLIFGAFTLFCSTASIAGAVEDEQWNSPQLFTLGYHGITIQNAGNETSTFSDLLATFNRDPNPNNFDRYVCHSTKDKDCVNADFYDFNSILPICLSQVQTDCVEGISTENSEGKISIGVYNKYTNDKHPNLFEADPSLDIPTDASPSIWTIEGTPHNFGNHYVVNVAISGRSFGKNNGGNSISASVTPISEMNGGAPLEPAQCRSWLDPARNHFNNACSINLTPNIVEFKCAYVDGDYVSGTPNCLLPHAFPGNTRFKLSIRLKSEPIGWFHGRLSDPDISITKNQSGIRLEVSGLSTRVPIASYGDTWNLLPNEIKDFWNKCETASSQAFQCGGAGNFSDPLPQRIGTMLLPPYGPAAIEALQAMTPVTHDHSVASPSTWRFNTIPSNSGVSACFNSGPGVKGIVTTNSTTYSEGPPTFDGSSLNYKVASLHYNPDGSVFKGTYNLVVRSDVARCLYNFTSAPIKASISVISADGSNDVATTIANEKNGWLYLSANGFTFSNPTISVKLTQDTPAPAPATNLSSDANSSSSTSNVNVTPKGLGKTLIIRCVKGKTTKYVSGIKPACPAGYKKK